MRMIGWMVRKSGRNVNESCRERNGMKEDDEEEAAQNEAEENEKNRERS